MNAAEVLQEARAVTNREASVRPRAAAPVPIDVSSPLANVIEALTGKKMAELQLSDLHIKPVDRAVAMDLVVREHYLHREPTFQCAFGLCLGDVVLGVIIFGRPVSFTLCKGICGPNESGHVIEITRLWVNDLVPKNGESFLIGGSLRLLRARNSPFDIVVSFADTSAGHLGRVYQATNFLYTGKNLPMRDPVPLGHVGHRLTAGKTTDLKAWYRTTTGKEPEGLSTFDLMELKFGKGKVGWVERSIKHRYVLFNGNRRRNRALVKELRYKVLPYPTQEIQPEQSASSPSIPTVSAGMLL